MESSVNQMHSGLEEDKSQANIEDNSNDILAIFDFIVEYYSSSQRSSSSSSDDSDFQNNKNIVFNRYNRNLSIILEESKWGSGIIESKF